MRHGRRWMRLFRLVVACLFFVVARPAAAADALAALDGIVLVADAEQQPTDDAVAPETNARSLLPLARANDVEELRALQSVRALRDRTYLRHCSLLR